MKQNYKEIELNIMVFALQDIITSSGLKSDDYADSEAMDDMYGSDWLQDVK